MAEDEQQQQQQQPEQKEEQEEQSPQPTESTPESAPEPAPEPQPEPDSVAEAKPKSGAAAEDLARFDELQSKLMTMEWDIKHGQINPGKKALYDRLKKEFDELKIKLEK